MKAKPGSCSSHEAPSEVPANPTCFPQVESSCEVLDFDGIFVGGAAYQPGDFQSD